MRLLIAAHALPLLCAACFLDASGVQPEGEGAADATSSTGGQGGQPTTGGSGGAGASGGGGAASGGGGEGGEASGGGAAGGGGAGGDPTGGGGAPPIVDCETQYGLAEGHMPCSEDATSCTFRTDTGGDTSCDQVCESFGGECLGMFDNGDACEILRPVACNYGRFGDAMCVCSRGCGGGIPCLTPTTCDDGMCAL